MTCAELLHHPAIAVHRRDGTPHVVSSLEQHHVPTSVGQSGGGNQAVVPTADDHCVDSCWQGAARFDHGVEALSREGSRARYVRGFPVPTIAPPHTTR